MDIKLDCLILHEFPIPSLIPNFKKVFSKLKDYKSILCYERSTWDWDSEGDDFVSMQ